MKIIILGDSISCGIGSRKVNYVSFLEQLWSKHDNDVQILNLSRTGSTIEYPLENIDVICNSEPNMAIIMYGSVDVQIRPDLRKNKYGLISMIPRRYKSIGGMLNPRPFCSKRLIRGKLDKLDNIYRGLVKRLVVLTQGTYKYMECDEFEFRYKLLLEALEKINCKSILLSTIYLDEQIYPGSNAEYIKCNSIINKLANKYGLKYIDVYNEFKTKIKENDWDSVYYKDHFHPNIQGCKLIAEMVYNEIGVCY